MCKRFRVHLLKKLKNLAGRLGRCTLGLQAHYFTLKQRNGKYVVLAYSLSHAVVVIDVVLPSSIVDHSYTKLLNGVE